MARDTEGFTPDELLAQHRDATRLLADLLNRGSAFARLHAQRGLEDLAVTLFKQDLERIEEDARRLGLVDAAGSVLLADELAEIRVVMERRTK